MSFEYHYRGRRNDIVERGGAPHPRPRVEDHGDVIAHFDIPVATRSGKVMWVDVFLPPAGAPAPAIASWTPYGKSNPAPIGRRFPRSGVLDDALSELVSFEAPDPKWWVPRGYAVVAADMPGLWHSTGPAHFMAPEEAEDYFDLIEWIGTREWCTGKVGLSGVSYLSVSQWRVAELHPPHLAAINPWEGWTDTYREVYRHGGIPETSFVPVVFDRWGATTPGTLIEDLEREFSEHPLFDDFWESKAAQLEKITVPALVTASWSDHGLHSRGTLEGFRRIASAQKWLFVHGRKKWQQYYSEDGLARQLEFFEKFLKGRSDTAVESWAPVTVEVRRDGEDFVLREFTAWPVPEVTYQSLYLGHDEQLADQPPAETGVCTYDGLASGLDAPLRVTWSHTFTEDTDLVGHATAELWVSAPEAQDMDLFVALFKRRVDGTTVGFPYYALWDDGAAALGWLRASHRELDDSRSTPWLPVLAHRRELPLEPDGPTRVTIEILPQGTRLSAGESLVLVVQGIDVFRRDHWHLPRHTEYVNSGPQHIHVGGQTPSRIVLPVVR